MTYEVKGPKPLFAFAKGKIVENVDKVINTQRLAARAVEVKARDSLNDSVMIRCLNLSPQK